jgi:hypothetical protein
MAFEINSLLKMAALSRHLLRRFISSLLLQSLLELLEPLLKVSLPAQLFPLMELRQEQRVLLGLPLRLAYPLYLPF